MNKITKIILSLTTIMTLNSNAGGLDISGQISDIAGSSGIGTDALNGLINGALGSDFYSSLHIDTDIFDQMGSIYEQGTDAYAQGQEAMKQVNQLLGMLGITGNINCFVHIDVDNPLKAIDLDRICKQANNQANNALEKFNWDKTLSGKFTIPGIGTIGCNAETSFNPIKEIDICSISKKTFQVLRDSNDPSKGYLDGGGVVLTPMSVLSNNSGTNTLRKTESSFITLDKKEDVYYKSGASIKELNDAFDIDNVFADKGSINSSIAEVISSDKPEEYALLMDYAKSEAAKKNAEDTEVGSGWDEHPESAKITKEIIKARPDYFGLPENNEAVEETIASMSNLLTQQFPYDEFAKSLEIYLGVQYGKINEDTAITSVAQAKEKEAYDFNDFLKKEVIKESKAAIEAMDADNFTIMEKVASSSGRLTSPTQQRLDKLPSDKKLAYVALANKQYSRDALIASMASRITKFKERIFDLKVEKTRVCASRFYDNVADSELNKIINSADALVY